MKNIHILPTDKPSRLAYDFDKLILNSRLLSPILYKTQNIYITNSEEIKDGDWMIRGNEQPIKVTKAFFWDFGVRYYKIILTTDQDLIKDGVQPIDDDFLEWFVKNPNYEEVKANKSYSGTYYIAFPYKIIIPKEGHKIYTQYDYFNDEFPKEEPKQETLEEDLINSSPQEVKALIRHYKGLYLNYKAIVDRQKRSYSEEEVEILLETLSKVLLYQGNEYRLPHYFEYEIEQVINKFKKL